MAKIYLAAASSFTVAIVLSQHPALYHSLKVTARVVRVRGEEAMVALNDHVLTRGWHAAQARIAEDMKPASDAVYVLDIPPQREFVKLPERSIAVIAPSHIDMPVHIAQPQVNAPVLERMPNSTEETPRKGSSPVEEKIARAAPRRIALAPQATQAPPEKPVAPPTIATDPAPVDSAQPSEAALARVAAHFRGSLTSEMLAHFDLFLFVSKASDAPIGQRMYVFQKQAGGDLAMLYNWPVSTGREKFEIAPNGTEAPSFTPAGYYELDPHRMYVHHFSGQWRQPMPYAMFFNWENHGYQTGLAIHGAAPEDIKFLGSRSSAGCIHLSPRNAALLFNLIRSQFKGQVPKFAYDTHTATIANDGALMHETDGNLQMARGYKVLVFIQNYAGENVVATLF